jgi:hypothetical protein
MSNPSYNSDPVYTPEEQRQRLSDLQKQYSQINSGGSNPFLDALSGLGSAIASVPATQTQAQLAWGIPFNADGTAKNIFAPDNSAAAQSAWSRSYEGKAALEQRNLMNQLTGNEGPTEAEARQALLMSFLQNTADTSGYDAALSGIANQRKQASKRYQTYSAQISDLFGNLGRKSTAFAEEQAGIGQQSAITRSQLAAQQAQQAERTRSADATRLKAATEARAALGLGESASAGAAGDIATLRGEQDLTDQQAIGQTTIDTILANEALAKLVSSRQAGAFDMAGQQAQQQLNMSYEDMLASLANAEAQTKIQRSQAISAGAPSVSERLAVLNADESYRQALANQGNVTNPMDKASVWIQASPQSAAGANKLLATFIPFFTSKGAESTLGTGKAPTLLQVVNAYAKENQEGADILNSDPALYSLLQAYTGLK